MLHWILSFFHLCKGPKLNRGHSYCHNFSVGKIRSTVHPTVQLILLICLWRTLHVVVVWQFVLFCSHPCFLPRMGCYDLSSIRETWKKKQALESQIDGTVLLGRWSPEVSLSKITLQEKPNFLKSLYNNFYVISPKWLYSSFHNRALMLIIHTLD